MALHLGGFPSGAGPVCPAVVTTFEAPSFPREASSLRPVAYLTHSVPTSLRMVSNQRSSSDPGQPGSRDPGFHYLVENSFESPQSNPTRIPSDRNLPLHRLKCCGLGCSRGQKDRLRKVVRAHKRAAHQCAGTECDLAWSPSLRGYSPGLQCCHYVRQCLCHCLSEKSGGHSVSTDVPHGHRYLRMGRKTVHDTDTQTSPWTSQCVSRSSEPQRSVSENRMESESSRSTACIPSLGQSTCGSVCTQVQHQTSNVHFSDSRTGGLEGRQSSPIVGRSVRLCVPTNGSDQTDSEQVDLAQSGADPHSPPLAETGNRFPDLLRLSIAFPLVLPPTAKLLKQSFSQHFHQRPRILNLHAWRLSVDPIKLGDFRNKCPTGSLFLKDNPRLTSMNRNGIPLENGVSLTELIHTRLLSPCPASLV